MRNRIIQLSIIYVLLTSVSFGLIGCTQPPKDAIIGTWAMNGTQDRIEFTRDGTIIISGMTRLGDRITFTGTYRFVDDNRMAMDISGGLFDFALPETIYEVSIDGKNMALIGTTPSGERVGMEFTKLD
jgi:hypothetical protein